jgi:hypothetical protein
MLFNVGNQSLKWAGISHHQRIKIGCMLVAITPKVTRVSITTKRIMVVIEVIENTIRNTTIEKK